MTERSAEDSVFIDGVAVQPLLLAQFDRCVLCGSRLPRWGYFIGGVPGARFEDAITRRNNPWPLAEHGQCCDRCNVARVIPARLAMFEGDAATSQKEVSHV